MNHFINIFCKKYQKDELFLSQETESCLLKYDFPGNIRELENAMQRAVTLAADNTIMPQHLPASIGQNRPTIISVKDFSNLTEAKRKAADKAEREFVADCLKATNGGIRKAAKMAGIDASNFHKIMKKHKINPATFKI